MSDHLQSVKQRFGIIGNAPGMNHALEVALRVAPTDLSVMVTGESGVGKEFFPQVIHAYSSRKHNTLIAVNCGAIPEGTIDSELFGHEKGSFTGASDSRKGYFEVADGGTIFLDEVAELPLATQVRLLRVLQTGEYIRVGSSQCRKTNVRVVAATNVDLQKALDSGRFRRDLYYRLNTVPIEVPALRERREDIYLLFRKFASDVALQYRMPAITLDDQARAMLEGYYWQGNIRQLKNVAEQISAVESTRHITAAIMVKYLPSVHAAPGAIPAPSGMADYSSDREILYKLLFDMRGELHEVRTMLAEMAGGRTRTPQPDIAGLLPGSYSSAPPMVMPRPDEPLFADSEEVADDHDEPMTKEKAQKEAILKALRRHGGRRKDAARELFISERTLYRKIKELGIDEF